MACRKTFLSSTQLTCPVPTNRSLGRIKGGWWKRTLGTIRTLPGKLIFSDYRESILHHNSSVFKNLPEGITKHVTLTFQGWFLSSHTKIHLSGGPCQQRITSWFPRAVRYCVCTSQSDFPCRTGGAFLVLLSFDKSVIKMLTSSETFPGWLHESFFSPH